ncbi:putative histone acetyltransferase HAC-like 1 [Panicum miliaceum]|uniref:Histone acetyltransferase HAC-like 1 n=1 Tax=Panicum miliaceum TaxID=4540 RepID=A0A3L6RT35_PANMI|nr:putative histone acetyltransferase HAC-like 1 [Panicum miliaceum]
MSGHTDQVGAGDARAGSAAGADDGKPRPRPMVRKAGPSWTDEQFARKRTGVRKRILRYLRTRRRWTPQQQPKLAEQLEEILYTEFPSKNDYYNMLKRGSVEAQLLPFACKILNARNRQNRQNTQVERQTTSSFSANMAATPFSTAWWLNLSVVQGTEHVGKVANHDGLSEQSASIPPVQNKNADERDRTDMGLPQHQPMGDMAFSGADQQFLMLRTATREKIIKYIERRPMAAMWDKRLSAVLARRFEDTLYTKFPNMNEYYNMMKGPIEPRLLFAIRTYKAQKQQNQQDPQMARATTSSSGTITQDVNHDDLCEQFASLLADVQNKNANEHIMTE